MIVAAQHDYVSIGQLAGRMQCSVRVLETAASDLRIEPALRLNGVVHFDGDQVEEITNHLKTQPA